MSFLLYESIKQFQILTESEPGFLEEEAQLMTSRQAQDAGYAGPYYHGTDPDYFANIMKDGFRVPIGDARSKEVSNGFTANPEQCTPIHPLGFGTYLTSSLQYAKTYSRGNNTVLTCYLKFPKSDVQTINLRSDNTWKKFWDSMGYDRQTLLNQFAGRGLSNIDPEFKQALIRHTLQMTNKMRSIAPAWEYLNKGFGSKSGVGDKTQIVVFNPDDVVIVDKEAEKQDKASMKRDDVLREKDIVSVPAYGVKKARVHSFPRNSIFFREKIKEGKFPHIVDFLNGNDDAFERPIDPKVIQAKRDHLTELMDGEDQWVQLEKIQFEDGTEYSGHYPEVALSKINKIKPRVPKGAV